MQTADLVALVGITGVGIAATLYLTSDSRKNAADYANGNTNAAPGQKLNTSGTIAPGAPQTQFTDGNSTGAVLGGIASVANAATGILGAFDKYFGGF